MPPKVLASLKSRVALEENEDTTLIYCGMDPYTEYKNQSITFVMGDNVDVTFPLRKMIDPHFSSIKGYFYQQRPPFLLQDIRALNRGKAAPYDMIFGVVSCKFSSNGFFVLTASKQCFRGLAVKFERNELKPAESYIHLGILGKQR